jgi:hypothetical protein
MDVIQSEVTATRDKKLMGRVLIALGAACLLIIAAVVGLTYAVVDMSKDTRVDNNVLVSKDGLQPLSTAALQQTIPLADLYKASSLSELDWLTHVTVPLNDGEAMLKIQSVFLVPGERLHLDTGFQNVSVEVTADGVSVAGDQKTSNGRRLLGAEDGGTGTGAVTGGRSSSFCATSDDSEKNDGEACSSPSDCKSYSCRLVYLNSPQRQCCKEIVGHVPDLFASGGRTPTYCVGTAEDGQGCEYDTNCKSGWCKGGICLNTSKKNWEPCTYDEECASKACGKLSADSTHPYLCCADGVATYAGVDYCKNLPVGAMCWSNAMCQTGLCKGNLGGLQRGLCSMG